MPLPLGRYLLEWGALVFVLALAASRAASALGAESRLLPAAAVVVAGAIDVAVYVLTGRALLGRPEGFMGLWGAALAVKSAGLGGAVGVVLALDPAGRDAFLLALVGAFALLSVHQVLRLVQVSDRAAAPPAASPPGASRCRPT